MLYIKKKKKKNIGQVLFISNINPFLETYTLVLNTNKVVDSGKYVQRTEIYEQHNNMFSNFTIEYVYKVTYNLNLLISKNAIMKNKQRYSANKTAYKKSL